MTTDETRLQVPEARRASSRRVLAEAAILTGLLLLVNVTLWPDDPGFVHWRIHPALPLTLLMVTRYGFFAGMVTAVLASAAHVVALILLAHVPTYLHLISPPFSTPLLLLLPTAVMVGMVVQRHLDAVCSAEGARAQLREENEELLRVSSRLRQANAELASKVVGEEVTLLSLYQHARSLNHRDRQEIYRGTAAMAAHLLEATAVSVWEVHGDEMHLAVCIGQAHAPRALPKGLQAQIEGCFDAAGVLAPGQLPAALTRADMPHLMARLTKGDQGTAAYLCIDEMPLRRYNAEAVRLLGVVADWASSSLNEVPSPAAHVGARVDGNPTGAVEPCPSRQLPSLAAPQTGAARAHLPSPWPGEERRTDPTDGWRSRWVERSLAG